MGFFKKLLDGLSNTRKNIVESIENVFTGYSTVSDELYDELEEVLIMADIGANTASDIITALKERVKKEKASDTEKVKELLADEITKILIAAQGSPDAASDSVLAAHGPTVILVIGVNGAGKTTSIGKLTKMYKDQGKKVLVGAADTFRAAAIDQLQVWCERNDVTMIRHQENSDPAAVIYDAVQAAKARNVDVLICDTAGRLQNKKNLMEELRKIYRIIDTQFTEAKQEVLLVVDANAGQNAMQQAKLFSEVADVTGIVLTKMDGTAKGGIVITIGNELKIPVRYICMGEGIDDIGEFSAEEFSKALFNKESEEENA